MVRNVVRYLTFARDRWDHFQLASFSPGAKAEVADLPVCSCVELKKPIFIDVKSSSVGKHYIDSAASDAILQEPTAPFKLVEEVVRTQTRSSFDPERLERGYRDIMQHAGYPQHDVPGTIRGLASRTVSRILDRLKLHAVLHSCKPDEVPFHDRALAGVKYTECKADNHDRALAERNAMEEHFLTDGFSLRKSTAFAQLARLQVPSIDNPKHRNVAADTFHRYLQDGITAHPWYAALLHENNPSSFGYNLDNQARVREKLLSMHSNANFELVAHFSSFDIGKLQDRGTDAVRFYNGVRSWEIRLAFMVLAQAFEVDDVDATLSLCMAHADITFKKVAYRRRMYTFSETIPSGTYFVYSVYRIICDFRMEMVCISLGDPRSERIVGGDDSYTVLHITVFEMEKVLLPLVEIGTALAPPPKTQIRFADDRRTHGLRFHGHHSLFASPFRTDADVVSSCVLLERGDNDSQLVAAERMKAIHIDAGRRPAWLSRVVKRLEEKIGFEVKPDFFWHERMWHAPRLLR